MYDNNITIQAMADYTAELWERMLTDEEMQEMYTDAQNRGLAV